MPERYFDQISSFFDLLLDVDKSHSANIDAQESSGQPIFGLAKGMGKYSDDINAFDDEVAELFGV